MEDSWFNFQWPVNAVDDHLSSITAGEENRHQIHAHAPFFENYEPIMEPSSRPTKQLKTHTSRHSFTVTNGQGTDGFTCNNLSSSQSGTQNSYVFNTANEGGSGGASMKSTTNTSRRIPPYQDHILAERKRREKLSEGFIALSALLPNLKKMDKASVLEDAIEHMKTLQEKVKTLEEQTSRRSNVESRRFEIVSGGGEMTASDEKISCFTEQLPEIKVRFIGSEVLIRIHCEKKPGVLERTLAEIEKLQLSVINSNAVIFADSMLHITVIGQMDKNLTMTMKDLVRKLHFGLKQFM